MTAHARRNGYRLGCLRVITKIPALGKEHIVDDPITIIVNAVGGFRSIGMNIPIMVVEVPSERGITINVRISAEGIGGREGLCETHSLGISQIPAPAIHLAAELDARARGQR